MTCRDLVRFPIATDLRIRRQLAGDSRFDQG